MLSKHCPCCGAEIMAVQEASEKICAEDYLRMKIAFLLLCGKEGI